MRHHADSPDDARHFARLDHRCNQVGASKPYRRVRLEIVVPDILGDLVVYGAHGQDVVIRLHESKEPAALPHRRLKAALKSDAFQESTYILGIIVKGHTLGCQDIEQTQESAAAWIFAGKASKAKTDNFDFSALEWPEYAYKRC